MGLEEGPCDLNHNNGGPFSGEVGIFELWALGFVTSWESVYATVCTYILRATWSSSFLDRFR